MEAQRAPQIAPKCALRDNMSTLQNQNVKTVWPESFRKGAWPVAQIAEPARGLAWAGGTEIATRASRTWMARACSAPWVRAQPQVVRVMSADRAKQTRVSTPEASTATRDSLLCRWESARHVLWVSRRRGRSQTVSGVATLRPPLAQEAHVSEGNVSPENLPPLISWRTRIIGTMSVNLVLTILFLFTTKPNAPCVVQDRLPRTQRHHVCRVRTSILMLFFRGVCARHSRISG